MSSLNPPDPNNRYASLSPEVQDIHKLLLAHYAEKIKANIAQQGHVSTAKKTWGKKRAGKQADVVNARALALSAELAELKSEFADLSGMNFADMTNLQVTKALVKVASKQEERRLEALEEEKGKLKEGKRPLGALSENASAKDVLGALRKMKRPGKGGVPADQVPSKALRKMVE